MGKLYFKLAKTNLSNNKPFYIPYIISSIITVAMLYMMSFLSDSKGLNKIMGADSLAIIFRLGVGIIVIFSYIFLFYTNSFIIKRRKKEIGVYNILGMENLSKVLFVETVYSAAISLVCGIIIGIAFSKFMLMVLYGIIGIHETVEFFVNIHGIILCIVSFGILFLLTFLYNFMQIKLANPIELLRGTSVGEKEPKTKILIGVKRILGGCRTDFCSRLLYSDNNRKSAKCTYTFLCCRVVSRNRNICIIYGWKYRIVEIA